MQLLKEPVSKKILTIGPDYKEHKGGIGAIIEVYQSFFECFNFVPSYRGYNSNLLKSGFFLKQIFVLTKVLLENKKIEIVHIHGSHGGSFYRKFILFLIAKKVFKKKIVYHIHSGTYNSFYFSSSKLQKKLIRYFVGNADALIGLAPYWGKFLSDNFECKKAPFIINNVIHKPDTVSSLEINNQFPCLNLLFLGKIGHNKGIFDLVEMLEKRKDFFSDKIKLYIGGDGDTEKLKNIISKQGLDNLITYVGWVDNEKKRDLFLKTHIYILPSYNEGLPISVLEAMSYALPVIATPVGGIPEVVENNINGILVTPGDQDTLESALCFFLKNTDKIKEYGIRSLAKVQSHFPDYVSRQLEELYKSL